MASTATSLTLDDFLALPEEKPYREYLRGEVIEKPMPNYTHGLLALEVGSLLRNYLKASREGRVAIEVRHAARDEEWVYLPDVSVRLGKGVQRRGALESPPDIAIEVLSPDDRAGYVMERVALYGRIGTSLVWVIDPDRETITSFRPGEAGIVHRRGDVLDARPVLREFGLDVAELFDAVSEADADAD
jgi:Uma2 family endonuclease